MSCTYLPYLPDISTLGESGLIWTLKVAFSQTASCLHQYAFSFRAHVLTHAQSNCYLGAARRIATRVTSAKLNR